MNATARLTFRGMAPTSTIDTVAQECLDKLTHHIRGVTDCHVVVSAPARAGGTFRVRVELHVPHRTVVAGEHGDDRPEHADACLAVRDAFRAAERAAKDRVDAEHPGLHGHGFRAADGKL